MRIRIVKNVDVDIEKPRLREVWPKYLHRNDIVYIDKIEQLTDESVNLILDNGDVLLEVPKTAFTPV
jgi:hypothetical protein